MYFEHFAPFPTLAITSFCPPPSLPGQYWDIFISSFPTESSLCWPANLGNGACHGVWLTCYESHYLKTDTPRSYHMLRSPQLVMGLYAPPPPNAGSLSGEGHMYVCLIYDLTMAVSSYVHVVSGILFIISFMVLTTFGCYSPSSSSGMPQDLEGGVWCHVPVRLNIQPSYCLCPNL